MCTAVSWKMGAHYFGRNLDLEYHHRETVTVTPRSFPLPFRRTAAMDRHLAMVGVAYVQDGYPLYYDAVNEAGVGMAGLNYPVHAVYHPPVRDKENVAPFELIPWVLGRCASAAEARTRLAGVSLLRESFSPALPLTPMHWLIADRELALSVEPDREGLRIHENPVGILTNEPPFTAQMQHLSNFLHLTSDPPEDRFSRQGLLRPGSRGLGAVGLPGDFSSASRFVRAAFVRLNSVCGGTEQARVSQFFHILGAAVQPMGSVRLENGVFERTVYSSCCNTERGIYYYSTYESSSLSAVDMYAENLNGTALSNYPMLDGTHISWQNRAAELP